MNQFLTRVYLTLMGALGGVHRRVATPARGANFIEYAMLGVIAVFIGFVFREKLTSAFTDILDQINTGLKGGGSAPTS